LPAREPLRLLLDADLSSHRLLRILEGARHDVLAAGFRDDLKQLDDEILFAFAQQERRLTITHNAADFPDILVTWAQAGRSHHGLILSHLRTNAFGEMERRFDLWFSRFPTRQDWIDRAVHL
jgi:predicted nuclease of predicted toxin-antitoxin system